MTETTLHPRLTTTLRIAVAAASFALLPAPIGCGSGTDSGSKHETEVATSTADLELPITVSPSSVQPLQKVGTVPGALTVGRGGEARYRLPLRAPEGRGGVQPSLALTHDGTSRNGIAGVGWSVSGLSRITPCPRTTARDGSPDAVGFDANDVYCLDGSRLIAVEGPAGADGTKYRAEKDQLIEVQSFGSASGGSGQPARFVARRPGGQIWTYSRQLVGTQREHTQADGRSPNRRQVVTAWALETVEDRNGNRLAVDYEDVTRTSADSLAFGEEDAVEAYPSGIHYTSHASGLVARRSVKFEYEDRPDVVDRFVSGVHVRIGKRLRRVVVAAPNPQVTSTVWTYELSYKTSDTTGRSLLDSATFCDPSGTCLPATKFKYERSPTTYSEHTTSLETRDVRKLPSLRTADFDGDGDSDVLYWDGRRQICRCVTSACLQVTWDGLGGGEPCEDYDPPSYRVIGEWKIAHSDGTSLGDVTPTGLRAAWFTRYFGIPLSVSGSSDDEYNPPLVLDFDGDGAADLFSARSGKIFSPARGGAVLQDLGSAYETFPPNFAPDVRFVGDFNGDGRVDLFANANRPVPVIRNTVDGIEYVDGYSGPAQWDEYQWSFRMGAGEPGFGAPLASGVQLYHDRFARDLGLNNVNAARMTVAMDVDGDRRTELLLPQPDNNYLTFETETDGTVKTAPTNLQYLWLDAVDGLTPIRWYDPIYIDINGDGLQDVVAVNGATVSATGAVGLPARINTGNGFGPWYLAMTTGYQPPEEQRSSDQIRAEMDPEMNTRLGPPVSGAPGVPMVDAGVRVVDFNHDGLQDFLVPAEGGPLLYISNGRGFTSQPAPFALGDPIKENSGQSYTFLGWSHRFGDVDGNGISDLIRYDLGGNIVITKAKGRRHDRLTQVINGMGHISRVTRSTLSDRSVYQPGTGCSFPQRCIVGGGSEVVSLLQRQSASGAYQNVRHEYADARRDVSGGGGLGFARRVVTELDTGRVTTRDYDLDTTEHGRFPLAGSVVAQRTDTPLPGGAVHVDRTTTEYQRSWSAGNRVVLIRPRTQTTRSYELSAPASDLSSITPDRERQVTLSWDAYGNQLSRDVRTSGHIGGAASTGTRTLVSIQYQNRPSDWLIGLPVRERITSTTADSSSSETRKRRFGWDAKGRLKAIAEAPSQPDLRLKTAYKYGAYGEVQWVVRSTHSANTWGPFTPRRDSFEYDAEFLYPTEHENALGHVEKLAVHPAYGELTARQDPNGLISHRVIDAAGREVLSKDASGLTITTERNAGTSGPLRVTTQDSTGARSSVEYNSAGAPVLFESKAFSGSTAKVEQRFDRRGNLELRSNAYIIDSHRRFTTYEHDNLGRPTLVTHADGTTERHTYSLDTDSHWDRNGNETRSHYDVNGRVARSVDVTSSGLVQTQFEYGPFDHVSRVIDSAGAVTTFSHDLRGRRISSNDPARGLRNVVYNPFNEIIREQGPAERDAGTHSVLERDPLGRVLRHTTLDGVNEYTWDAPPSGAEGRNWIGARHAALSADGIETRVQYDELGRPSRQLQGVDGDWLAVDFSYTAASQLETVRYPEIPGRARLGVRMAYASNGQLKQVADADSGDAYWTVAARWADGRVRVEDAGNGLRTLRTFDVNTGRLQKILGRGRNPATGVWETRFSSRYWYDAGGNLIRHQESALGRNEHFGYDQLDRLTSWRVVNSPTSTDVRTGYRYDAGGNLLERSRSGLGASVVETMSRSDATNPTRVTRYLRRVGSTTEADIAMNYDSSGRRTAGGFERASYTSFDLPRRVEGSVTHDYRYDADNRRVIADGSDTVSRRFGKLYERREQRGTIAHIFTVPGDEGPVAQITQKEGAPSSITHYLHRDRLGSATALSGDDGAVSQRQWFSPFGARVDASGASAPSSSSVFRAPGFTGHDHDDGLGLIDMNGRVYDPTTATFLSPDPIVSSPGKSQSWNPYSYVVNNPLAYTDPSGFDRQHVFMGFDGGGADEIRAVYDTYDDGELTGYTFAFPPEQEALEEQSSDDLAEESAGYTFTEEEVFPVATHYDRGGEISQRLRMDVQLDYKRASRDPRDRTLTPASERGGTVNIFVEYRLMGDRIKYDVDVTVSDGLGRVAPRIVADAEVRIASENALRLVVIARVLPRDATVSVEQSESDNSISGFVRLGRGSTFIQIESPSSTGRGSAASSGALPGRAEIRQTYMMTDPAEGFFARTRHVPANEIDFIQHYRGRQTQFGARARLGFGENTGPEIVNPEPR